MRSMELSVAASSLQKIQILGLPIDRLNYSDLINIISQHVNNNTKCTITYANVQNLNVLQSSHGLCNVLNSFDIIHPDGIGIYLASKILYGNNSLKSRFVGSDFFELLNQKLMENNWSVFFFGDEKETLERIRIANPGLNISGTQDGFQFDTNKVIEQINRTKPNIILIGMGFPKQELWIAEHKDKLRYNVIIAIGEALRVFSKTKVRGPVLLRNLGLEWFVRLLHNPKKLWKRYIIGNPLFLCRIFKHKMINLFKRQR